ncbi:alpha/beta hydrolase [Tundrisphaera lichenicola]|uniref:alpha/beta hydrolase n=1 Tax=Tundrisphaera lichenicola TaxID=2029860 RepID=UPI003EBC8AC7
MRRQPRTILALILAFVALAAPTRAQNPKPFTGPWNLEGLKAVPKETFGEASGTVREVFYEGAPLDGKPTRVFGYYARPSTGDGPFPAMLLVHGGGGQAFEQWAKLWAERGYVALAMDLAGNGPGRKRLPDGGPDQDDSTKFRDFTSDSVDQMWTYHAVAAVLKGHSLLASRAEVDPSRIGVTGISWGGYLTCIIAGVDDRIKVAVPVYGCGFLHEESYWKPERFDGVPADRRDRWVRAFDPSTYLPGVRCPILFVNGTNDFAYPLNSYQKSYLAVPGFEALDNPDRLCVTLRMPHGHEQGWAPREIGLFVDSVLKGGDPLPKLGSTAIEGGKATAKLVAKVPIEKAELLYTTDEGPWPARLWQTAPASVVGDSVEAPLPSGRPLVVFLNVVDRRGVVSSAPHAIVPEGR